MMNDKFFKLMEQHVSVRNFKEEPLEKDIKDQLLMAAYSGSSSNFLQATSIIEVTDPKIRNQLATIARAPHAQKSGAFFVFVADMYRLAKVLEQKGNAVKPITSMESLMVSIVDTTISAENMALAAEAIGLGICYIGGIRNDLTKVSTLLDLPKYTVPLFGLTIGIPKSKNDPKPRMPLKNHVFNNRYNTNLSRNLAGYDETMRDYYAHRNSNSITSDWTTKTSDFLTNSQRPDIAPFLRHQGFEI
ncbi:NADPH-dependent oxidoreductase [Limosilactobacillus agrestis]